MTMTLLELCHWHVIAGALAFAQAPAGRIVLPEPNPTSRNLLLLAILMAILGVWAFRVIRAYKSQHRHRSREKEKAEAFLAHRGLSKAEHQLLAELVTASGEPLERVVKLVLCFDRAVERHLASVQGESAEERLSRLRRLKTIRSKLALHRVPAGVQLLSARELPVGQQFLLRPSAEPRGEVLVGTLVDWDDTGLVMRVTPCAESPRRPGLPLEAAASNGGSRSLPASGLEAPPLPPAPVQAPPPGTRVDACFLRPNDGGYRFTSELTATVGGQADIWHLAHPRKLSREQRRDYLRVPICEEIHFGRAPTHVLGESRNAATLRSIACDLAGTVLDISGGGFKLLAPAAGLCTDELIVARLTFLPAPLADEPILARGIKVHGDSGAVGFAFEGLPTIYISTLARYVDGVHRQVRAPTQA